VLLCGGEWPWVGAEGQVGFRQEDLNEGTVQAGAQPSKRGQVTHQICQQIPSSSPYPGSLNHGGEWVIISDSQGWFWQNCQVTEVSLHDHSSSCQQSAFFCQCIHASLAK
jgi:hypothetical protein